MTDAIANEGLLAPGICNLCQFVQVLEMATCERPERTARLRGATTVHLFTEIAVSA
jgi:hypothetical protein